METITLRTTEQELALLEHIAEAMGAHFPELHPTGAELAQLAFYLGLLQLKQDWLKEQS